jgi:hydroxyacylglutathione hydrolase
MQTTAAAKKAEPVAAAPKKDVFVDGVKAGVDEGTVDGEWLKALIAIDKVPANVALVDIRNAPEYANGHLKGAKNVEAAKLSAAELAAKLPKDKVIVFACGTGARAMEAYLKLKNAKLDVSKTMYFDANIKCDAKNTCEIKVNEPFS